MNSDGPPMGGGDAPPNRGPGQSEQRSPDRRPDSSVAAEREGSAEESEPLPSPFVHPEWTVGLVLVAGVITLLFGLLVSPVWLLVGSPFVLALVLWLYVRLFATR